MVDTVVDTARTTFAAPESLASRHTNGYLTSLSDEAWQRVRNRARRQAYAHLDPTTNYPQSALWMYDNLQPVLTCPHMERVTSDGGLDDGGKWLCDPYRLGELDSCLIYSIGSNGQYGFEDTLAERFDNRCEIHVFDPGSFDRPTENPPRNIHFHPWGLKASVEASVNPVLMQKDKNMGKLQFKSFPEILKALGHEHRTIDVFKIDCELCEWTSIGDWIHGNIRQIQVEVHGHNKPVPPTGFFDSFRANNFILFSKEKNILPPENIKHIGFYEYSFLKVTDEFWEDSREIKALQSYRDSGGLLNDISDESWERMKDRIRRDQRYTVDPAHIGGKVKDHEWYMWNVLPNFACTDMERVGGLGEGPKWVCNPHRLGPDCLVYAFGSIPRFERALPSRCEIHVFDPIAEAPPFEYNHVQYHKWGLSSSYDAEYNARQKESDGSFKTFQDTRQALGHESRSIDILSLDCDGCEWYVFVVMACLWTMLTPSHRATARDWIGSGARQILVETHNLPHSSPGVRDETKIHEYFDSFQKQGYALFSKEMKPEYINVEWSYLKLDDTFWESR